MSDDRPIDFTTMPAIPGSWANPSIPGTRADSPSMHATELAARDALSDIEMAIPMTPDAVSVAGTDDTDLESMFSIALTDLESGKFNIDLGLGRSTTPSVSEASTAASVDGRSLPTSNVAPANRPQYAPLEVFCGTCGTTVEMERARCRSKHKQTWVCKRCEVKLVTLRRTFGTWPVPGFTKITKEDQQAFYRDCRDASSLKRELSQRFQIYEETERQYYVNGGKFLPLSVWDEKGYNVADIEEKSLPEDIRVDPIMGLTYRVKIMEMGQKGEKRHVARQAFSARSVAQSNNAKQRSANAKAKKSKIDASTGAVTDAKKPRRLPLAAACGEEASSSSEEASSSSEEASSSSDSSSSDSSSSFVSKKNSRQNAKKAKKYKKEKKGRAKKAKKDKKETK